MSESCYVRCVLRRRSPSSSRDETVLQTHFQKCLQSKSSNIENSRGIRKHLDISLCSRALPGMNCSSFQRHVRTYPVNYTKSKGSLKRNSSLSSNLILQHYCRKFKEMPELQRLSTYFLKNVLVSSKVERSMTIP